MRQVENAVRILLVEDDLRLSNLIRDYLQPYALEVIIEPRGDYAVNRIQVEKPDLLVLDLMLPGKDGFSICREIRTTYPGPILMLTARDDDMDQVAGLEMGADDYVKKPVLPRVLLARIRALLRRFNKEGEDEPLAEELRIGGLKISQQDYLVTLDDTPVDLSTNEFELLRLLAIHAGQVLTRDQLFAGMRGIAYNGFDRSVDITISHLRRKLDDDAGQPRRIKTIWGKGYLLVKNAW
jgi:DNA-binding response OmpR family regulator